MPINRRNREEVELTVKRKENMILLIGSDRREEKKEVHGAEKRSPQQRRLRQLEGEEAVTSW